ncbi:MAG: hypothetical protein LBI38_05380 [Oscillospiraceae bacterium]|jgi:hypothetical protein|nr:hypothetical protein [Oscillospiraceae bacterium]
MKYEFWNLYVNNKFNYYYHERYRRRDERVSLFLEVFASVVSLLSVSGWIITQKHTEIWSTIILFMNITLLLKDRFKVNDRINAFKYYLPELDNLLCEMASDWRKIEAGDLNSDGKLIEIIRSYEIAHFEITNKYLSPLYIPRSKRIAKYADSDTDLYISILNKRGETYEHVTKNAGDFQEKKYIKEEKAVVIDHSRVD